MSVLIRDMAMPKNCGFCPFCRKTVTEWGSIYSADCIIRKMRIKFSELDLRDGLCPLVELPPHGDLIDRDALNNAFTGMRFDADGFLLHWGDREDWYLKGSEVETLITNATTIIEAESEE